MESLDVLLRYASLFAEAAGPRNEYMRTYMRDRKRRKRQEIEDRLGGKCSKCGDKVGPFHIDHINKKKKTMRASDLHSVNDQRFEKEMKNLQLLCTNCHKDKTKESWDFGAPKPKHSTYWMYRNYGCRCPGCVKAYKEKQKEWRTKKASSPVLQWVQNTLPLIVRKYMVQDRQLKDCGGISSKIVKLAREAGFEAFVIPEPGHFVAYIEDGDLAYRIDATHLQSLFTRGSLKDFSPLEREEDEYHKMKKLFDELENNPMKAVDISVEKNPGNLRELAQEFNWAEVCAKV